MYQVYFHRSWSNQLLLPTVLFLFIACGFCSYSVAMCSRCCPVVYYTLVVTHCNKAFPSPTRAMIFNRKILFHDQSFHTYPPPSLASSRYAYAKRSQPSVPPLEAHETMPTTRPRCCYAVSSSLRKFCTRSPGGVEPMPPSTKLIPSILLRRSLAVRKICMAATYTTYIPAYNFYHSRSRRVGGQKTGNIAQTIQAALECRVAPK